MHCIYTYTQSCNWLSHLASTNVVKWLHLNLPSHLKRIESHTLFKVALQRKRKTIQLPVNYIHTLFMIFILWLQYNTMRIQNCVKYTFLWYYLCYNESKSVGCTEVHFSQL